VSTSLGDHTLKPHSMQIERLDEHVDHMDRVVFAAPSTKRPIRIPHQETEES
jgi:hypothetical protein